MKRLAILSALTLVLGAAGCHHSRQQVYRPCTPPCAPMVGPCGSPCGTPTAVYSAPSAGAVMVPGTSTPVLTVPAQTIPGPEAYTPAN